MLQMEDYNFRQVKVAKEMELKQKSLMGKNTKNYVELAPSFQLCFPEPSSFFQGHVKIYVLG